MRQMILRTCAVLGVLGLCLVETNRAAAGNLTVDATVGGTPLGGTFANFNDLTLGNSGGTSGGIAVSFTGTGQAVQGSSSGLYAAPVFSNNNGVPFDGSSDGPDGTTYLSTGIGSVTLALPGEEHYVGLLWGSVDTYNTLSLFDGSNLVGTITGSDVTASANGDQGPGGTYYVNIISTASFNEVVASSTSYAFEFDNVAYAAAVPEPSSIVLGVIGGLGVLTCRLVRKKKIVVG
jgi:hypothetical protein